MNTEVNIKQMFDNIAKNYDKLNGVITLGMNSSVKKRAVENVALKQDFKVLDVCCGTGDIAIYIAKNRVKYGSVVGVDFSQNMLELAKKKAVGLDNIEFMLADVMKLPFGDGEFDVCFVSFGLRNLPDFEKALREMKRVTKKGGYVANLDTGKPSGIVGFFHRLFFFHIVPFLGRIFNGDAQPYKYLPESTENFPSGDELVEMFKNIGLKNVQKLDFLFGAISEQVGEV